MAEADIFEPDDRVELIDGEVFELAPIGVRHAAVVRRLERMFSSLGDSAMLSVQSPIQVGEMSEPQPDVAVLRFRADFYSDHHPTPPEILLLIEVSDTSLRHDLDLKSPLYIAGGVPEVWVVDLVTETLHVARGRQTVQLRAGDSVAPLAFPDVVLVVSDILGRVS